MDMSLRKRWVTARLALMVGLGVVGCMVFADVSSAKVPPTGLNCQASDGKVNGRGSTFQKKLILSLAATYRDDFCGATGTEGPENGEANNTMIAYNYPAAESAGLTGSGAGIKSASCRTDAFAGTDVPYSQAELTEKLNGAPGVTGGCELPFTPPFQPNSPAKWPSKEAGLEDIQSPIMSFPIGGSSVALPVHLTSANCGGNPAPTSLTFTAKEVDRMFGGEIATWNDAELVANNPSLKECTAAVTRVVRFDNSGTTNVFKLYLQRIDPERAGAKCAETVEVEKKLITRRWEEYNVNPNVEWPGKGKNVGKEGTCSEITTAGTSGGGALIKKVVETSASIGYADLADAVNTEAKTAGLVLPSVTNAAGTSAQAPNAGKAGNCDYKTLSLPGASASDAVGLNTEDDWANNNKEGNRGNATDVGTKYPICGLTWDLVYTGLADSSVPNADRRLSADQRRTMYSFFTFALSSAGQDTLSTINYAALPISWVSKLREGFQANF
jgi:ABC-type phosphate transport system substrate-binding protein